MTYSNVDAEGVYGYSYAGTFGPYIYPGGPYPGQYQGAPSPTPGIPLASAWDSLVGANFVLVSVDVPLAVVTSPPPTMTTTTPPATTTPPPSTTTGTTGIGGGYTYEGISQASLAVGNMTLQPFDPGGGTLAATLPAATVGSYCSVVNAGTSGTVQVICQGSDVIAQVADPILALVPDAVLDLRCIKTGVWFRA